VPWRRDRHRPAAHDPRVHAVSGAASSGRAALGLAIASVAAGLLNYLFQVHAAAVLDASAFGRLSAWLAQVTLVTAVAPVVQFVSLDWSLADARFARLSRGAGLVSLLALGGHALLSGATLLLGVASVAGAVLLYAMMGQLQRRLRLADVAVMVPVSSNSLRNQRSS